MNLIELKAAVEAAIERAGEYGEKPDDVMVTLQIDGPGTDSVWTDGSLELCYDGNAFASGCVIVGWKEEEAADNPGSSSTAPPVCLGCNNSRWRVVNALQEDGSGVPMVCPCKACNPDGKLPVGVTARVSMKDGSAEETGDE